MPDWLSWDFWAKDSQSLNHLALIIAGVIGIPLLAIRTFAANKSAKAADAQARTAEQGHITDRFTKAVEQLGSDKLAVRLGAIYALERISKDSRQDYWPIMETLTAYVREHAPWPTRQAVINPFVELQSSGAVEESRPVELAELYDENYLPVLPPTDIQAILTVLGRRDETARKQDQTADRSLDLGKTHLDGVVLGSAHLDGVFLRRAHLQSAFLGGAHLKRANLGFAHLQGADLGGAHLEGADLGGAHLEGAHLGGAHLEGAYLGGAHLEGTYFDEAHLQNAYLGETTGLTQGQLDVAFGNDRTLLFLRARGLTRPARWPAEVPEEPDNAK